MLGLAGVPSVIQCIGFLFMPESPRWLVSKGKADRARRVLQRIRATDDVEDELGGIIKSCEEDDTLMASRGMSGLILSS